jgi:hypothetical protein
MSVYGEWRVYTWFSHVVVWYAKFSSVTRTQRAFRRRYICHHVPSHRGMFLENDLTLPHAGRRLRDSNREEDIRQAAIQSPRKSREILDDTCNNHWCGHDGPIPWPATPPDFSCGGTSSHFCTDKDHRMKLISDRRSPPTMWRNFSAPYELCPVRRDDHVEC